MKKIIFVCTGNTCRSPMAEMIMKDLLNKAKVNNIEIHSRGLNVFDSSPVSHHVKTLMSEQDIDLSPHCSCILSEDDLAQNTLILTMTYAHKQLAYDRFPKYSKQIYTLAEYTTGSNIDIQDPYGGTIDIYRRCFLQLEGLLKELVKNLPTL